jgi:hypothetical protein
MINKILFEVMLINQGERVNSAIAESKNRPQITIQGQNPAPFFQAMIPFANETKQEISDKTRRSRLPIARFAAIGFDVP